MCYNVNFQNCFKNSNLIKKTIFKKKLLFTQNVEFFLKTFSIQSIEMCQKISKKSLNFEKVKKT